MRLILNAWFTTRNNTARHEIVECLLTNRKVIFIDHWRQSSEMLLPVYYRPLPKYEGRYYFQSVHTCRGGGTPSQVWMGGTPSQVQTGEGYPILGLDGGYSILLKGVTPIQDQDRRYAGWGTPSPIQD